ncbi:enoyl-CoA hydratase [Parendozoicomonas haliclonae]|uniref:2,3-dehydroadipyl-CoA hydratase n=1 Tax=Parendozoicomonas haliclonae TaxID=1960125 RepID=A0A1X7ALS9_9GAMM|nr:enoyl-CoA hydratase [Parendozoicomonas haliclonae]SMA48648.1 2,3-dehydroadipyl-CoA hydratase [Parendozoicomonas haliclonae]
MSEALILEKRGSVATITLNNPPANTWTLDSLNQLEKIVQELNVDREIVSLVIVSDSPKFFSAGADLKQFADGDKEQAAEVAQAFGRAFETLTDFRGVSIAAINGYAMGGGLEVALACDLRIAGDQAVMALPEASVGLLPCAGGTQNLTLLVGEGWAKRMILCGERVNAEQAQTIGLVEEVVATDDLRARALELAHQVAKQSPDSIAACKQLVQMGRSLPQRQVLPAERELFIALFDGENQKEGVNAFLEKRTPAWQYD